MAKYLIRILIMVFVINCKAQQFSFNEKPRNGSGYSCSGFDNYFRWDPSVSVSINTTDFYKLKKVKTIHIYSNDNKLQVSFELDTAGKIFRWGENIQTCFKVGWTSGANPHYSAVSYYKDSVLIRTDTNCSTHFSYKNGDTLMEFDHYEGKIYKNGGLLNEQNNYFNEKYLRKRIRVNRGEGIVMVNRFGRPIRGKRMYLKKRIPSDFEPERLYFAEKSISENWFYAYVNNQKIDTTKLKRHPFYRLYHPRQKTTGLVPGENFHEPENCGYGYPCHHIYAGDRAPSFEHHEFTLNPEGLYDEYISVYFPQDTNKVAIEKFKQEMIKERENYKDTEGYSFSDEFSHLYPRLQTPVKTRLYYMRYTYFKNEY